LAQPGVIAALTGEDLRHVVAPIPSRLEQPTFRSTAWHALAVDKVRFVGEAVAVVVAGDRYRAEDALDGVRVEYEPLAPIVDVEAAMAGDAPRLHEQHSGNVLLHLRYDNGRVDEAFARAEVVLRETFRLPRATAAPIENRGVLASPDRGSGILTVWTSTQTPHLVRTGLAECLGVPETAIRVVAPAVGGGFGMKMHLFPEEVVVAALALRLGRPVKWTEDRRENFLASSHAREHVSHVELAARRDGTILGMKATLLCDVGAYSVYPTTVSLEPASSSGTLPGPYRFDGYRYDAFAVATNKCPTGAYRGVGMVLSTFARERLVDMLAARLGLEPAQVRARNFVPRHEFPYTSPSGMVIDSGSYGECLARLREAVPLTAVGGERPHDGGVGGRVYRGVGLCAYAEFTATGSGTFRRRGAVHVPGFDAASVKVEPSGAVRAFVSAASQGQGHRTSLAQILADELGVPFERISIVQADTDTCPYGSGTFASRSMISTGGALILAARDVRAKMLRLAAHLMEAAPDDLTAEDGEIFVRGVPSRRLTFDRVVRAAYQPGGGRPDDMEPGLEATRRYDPPTSTFSNGLHLAVVDVDIDTGQVTFVRYVVVEDCGRVVNPMIVGGQLHGAVAQGVGNALLESLVYAPNGQLLTTSFMDYLLPTSMDTPMTEVIHVETLPPVTIGGFKGTGEGGTVGAVTAVANAIAHALRPLGVEVRELPLSPDRIVTLVRQAEAAS
jgi:carbon-monoxide dehydrogenase large subunit